MPHSLIFTSKTDTVTEQSAANVSINSGKRVNFTICPDHIEEHWRVSLRLRDIDPFREIERSVLMPSAFKRPLLAAVMLIAGLLVGLFSRNALRQSSSTVSPSSDVGRYQLFTCGQSENPFVYLIDTKTGRVWMKGTPGDPTWEEQAAPSFKNK